MDIEDSPQQATGNALALLAQMADDRCQSPGKSGGYGHVPVLIGALKESLHDVVVRGMSAWALGRLGSRRAKKILAAGQTAEDGIVRQEIENAR